ncbi:MAG TPA: hypothetical protein VF546_09560 [Pyrinomonadaceae bacterium]|jgi:hypothetical protein
MATKKGQKEQKVVLTIPDMGLSKTQISGLKRQFQNQLVESLGGKERLAARSVVIVVVVVVVYAA